jgi:hypothetical protein
VEYVFFKRSAYTIYNAGSKGLAQLSDDEGNASKQAAAIANLLPLRDQLQYLVAGLNKPHPVTMARLQRQSD